jgi:hypothetical protein
MRAPIVPPRRAQDGGVETRIRLVRRARAIDRKQIIGSFFVAHFQLSKAWRSRRFA